MPITVNIINEQQYVLTLDITEIFRDRKTRKCGAHTASGRFVHLTVDECGVFNNSRLFHIGYHIVTFSGTLTDTRKNGIAAVFL